MQLNQTGRAGRARDRQISARWPLAAAHHRQVGAQWTSYPQCEPNAGDRLAHQSVTSALQCVRSMTSRNFRRNAAE